MERPVPTAPPARTTMIMDDRPLERLIWRLPERTPLDLAARTFPLFEAKQAQTFPGLVLWDSWPLLRSDNSLYANAAGEQHWFALAAPRRADPDQRHDEARITHLIRSPAGFRVVGSLFPDDFTPGSREWSGSAMLDEAGEVTLRFTAAGRRGDGQPSAEQRLFTALASFDGVRFGQWQDCREIVAADDRLYVRVGRGPAVPGRVKGFRDPEAYRDEDGRDWLLFTASQPDTNSDYDGVIGLARVEGRHHQLLPALVDATGCSRELERPHIRAFGGRLYLFWSVQSDVLAPQCRNWPTGLYGATAERMEGPWTLLNGDGLVAGNPPDRPAQSYSWLVLPSGEVTSFADRLPVDGRSGFVGGFAPFVRLGVNAERAWIDHAG